MNIRSFVILLSFFLFHCKNEKIQSIPNLLLEEEYISIIEDCRNNNITDSIQLTGNLVGKWVLVAYGCGFCVQTDGLGPEVVINLTPKKGILDYNKGGTNAALLELDWSIEKTHYGFDKKNVYQLVTEPTHFALSTFIFCEDFMFFDKRGSDGLLMLYEKQ